jgi:tRNA pseudouridine32 synthase / 23S rRNA pseudouridine746 synthase
MSIALRPSFISLPPQNKGWGSLLDFLCDQFPHIERTIWQSRLRDGKLQWRDGDIVTSGAKFEANRTLSYYREVQDEPIIKGAHKILFQNEHFIIADKPHFLPVTPGGKYVNECLLERLRIESDRADIVSAHRIDRTTAGLVLLSTNVQSRSAYCQLFMDGAIEKRYFAVANISNLHSAVLQQHWQVENRIVRSEPKFTFRQTEGVVNARSNIRLLNSKDELGMFELSPITGKTHQLRLHMMSIGAPILFDSFYPHLLPEQGDNEEKPLQLLAKELSFVDPLTQIKHHFFSEFTLKYWAQSDQ